MKKFILLFSVSILIVFSSCETDDSNPATPSNGTIHGKVTNITGDTVIVNANVSTIPATSSVSTNSSGDYTINYVSPGTYTVTAAKGGYNSGNVSVNVISGKTTTANIQMSIQTGTVLPTQGLVAYYPFNGNANDESGNGLNGIVKGAALGTDRFGLANYAYYFDGINNYIECNDPISFNDFTIAAWINTMHNASTRKEIINGGDYSSKDKGYHLYKDNNKVRFDLSNHPSTFSMSTINNGSWTFLVGTCGSGSMRLFINGTMESNYSSTANLTPVKLMIGSDQTKNQSSFWQGKIDDIRIYNRVLSTTEIQQLYHEGGW